MSDFLIMGKVPGTDLTINFEAFMQGVLGGLIALLVVKLISAKSKNLKTDQTK